MNSASPSRTSDAPRPMNSFSVRSACSRSWAAVRSISVQRCRRPEPEDLPEHCCCLHECLFRRKRVDARGDQALHGLLVVRPASRCSPRWMNSSAYSGLPRRGRRACCASPGSTVPQQQMQEAGPSPRRRAWLSDAWWRSPSCCPEPGRWGEQLGGARSRRRASARRSPTRPGSRQSRGDRRLGEVEISEDQHAAAAVRQRLEEVLPRGETPRCALAQRLLVATGQTDERRRCRSNHCASASSATSAATASRSLVPVPAASLVSSICLRLDDLAQRPEATPSPRAGTGPAARRWVVSGVDRA